MAARRSRTSVDRVPTARSSATLRPNNTTGKGKELRIVPVGKGSAMYRIAFYPGGEVPDVWKNQKFTSLTEAQKEIDRYLR
jgi:hypothetical protein